MAEYDAAISGSSENRERTGHNCIIFRDNIEAGSMRNMGNARTYTMPNVAFNSDSFNI